MPSPFSKETICVFEPRERSHDFPSLPKDVKWTFDIDESCLDSMHAGASGEHSPITDDGLSSRSTRNSGEHSISDGVPREVRMDMDVCDKWDNRPEPLISGE